MTLTRLAAICTLCLCLAQTLHAQDDASRDHWRSLLCLSSADKTSRTQALNNLLAIRADVTQALLRDLSILRQNPDRIYGSQLHLTVQLLGKWREESAVHPLLDIIDYEVDASTFPMGAKYAPAAHFPVAAALAEIGGSTLPSALLTMLRGETQGKRAQVALWTLREVCGTELATAMVDKALAGTDEAMGRKRLQDAKALLAGELPLLPTTEER